jgi:DNA mismatch endonuclease, patch repair protein
MKAVDPVRSRTMRAVRSKDTKPEIAVRSTAHRLGYRFRIHRKDLPGSPDLVFPKHRLVIFVHGCFWHGHHCSRGSRVPKTNSEYWKAKVRRNVVRDARVVTDLRLMGWQVITIWECETKDKKQLEALLQKLLLRARFESQEAGRRFRFG